MNVNSFQDRERVTPCQALARIAKHCQASPSIKRSITTSIYVKTSEIMNLEFQWRSKTKQSFGHNPTPSDLFMH